MRIRAMICAAALAVGAVLGSVGVASAAPAPPAPKAGHLNLTVNGVTTLLPPGQAKQAAVAACAQTGVAVVVDIDAVRAAFPAPFTVCPGVTLTSQVAADVTPTPLPPA